MPAAPSHQTLTAVAPDGVRLEARLFEPSSAARASVLCLPALGIAARYYDVLAQALVAEGLAVASLNLRGTGDSEVTVGRGVDFGYWQHVQDVGAAIATLRARHPTRPLVLLGHSFGGQLGTLQLGRAPGSADGLVLVGAGTAYWRCRRGSDVLRVLAGCNTAAAVASLLGYYPGGLFGFGGTQPRGVIHDWARLSRSGRFDLPDTDLNLEARMRDVQARVLSISVQGDWFSPPASADHLAKKLGRATVERHQVSLPDDPKGRSPHFRWAHHPDRVVPLITDWLTSL